MSPTRMPRRLTSLRGADLPGPRLVPARSRRDDSVARALAGLRHLTLLDPVAAPAWSTSQVVGVQRETHDATTLTLDPSAEWTGFRAGQQVRLRVDVDGSPSTGRFWFSSSDQAEATWGDRTVSVVVHSRGHDPVSRHLARHAAAGTAIEMSPAEGMFTLPPLVPRPLLLVSGGAGVVPLMAMLRSLVDGDHEGRIVFVHFARTPEETYFAGELDEIAEGNPDVELSVLHTRTGDQRLHELQLHSLAPRFAQTTTYASGPDGLLATLRRLYAGRDTLHLPAPAVCS